jgi:hypothetical protein
LRLVESITCGARAALNVARNSNKQVRGRQAELRNGYAKNGRFDLAAVKPIARCGYDEYTAIEKVFPMMRPASGGNARDGG